MSTDNAQEQEPAQTPITLLLMQGLRSYEFL